MFNQGVDLNFTCVDIIFRDSADSEDQEWDKMYVKKERSLAEKDEDKGPYVTRSGRSTNSSSRIKKYM